MEIDKENLNKLTDDELFKTLKKCGIATGPITGTTRSLYEKRLRKYLETKNPNITLNNSCQEESFNKSRRSSIKPVEKQATEEVPKSIPKKSIPKPEEPKIPDMFVQKKVETPQKEIVKPKLPEPIVSRPITVSRIEPEAQVVLTRKLEPQPEIFRSKPEEPKRRKDDLDKFTDDTVVKASSSILTRPVIQRIPEPTITRSIFDSIHRQKVEEPVRPLLKAPMEMKLLNPSQTNDKFTERLSNYGLLGTPGGSTIRSRAPLHTEKPKLISSNSISSSLDFSEEKKKQETVQVKKEQVNQTSQQLNFKPLIAVFLVTVIVYFFFMQLQHNPENPID